MQPELVVENGQLSLRIQNVPVSQLNEAQETLDATFADLHNLVVQMHHILAQRNNNNNEDAHKGCGG